MKWLEFLNYASAFDLITVAASLILLLAARPICRWLNQDDGLATRISMMRSLNVLIIAAVAVNLISAYSLPAVTRVTQALIVVYFAVLSTQLLTFAIRLRFGKKRTTHNTTVYSDTYSSRGLSLIVTTIITVITIVTCLRVLGLNSLLEAGGALGILGLLLVTTQASWAPDIISGLIILHSRLCEEGDVVQFRLDGDQVVATVFKTKLFHSEFLDLANNHRFMVRNAKLRDLGLQNLSRFASSKGLRECILLNIGYEHAEKDVTGMVERAFARIEADDLLNEAHSTPEVRVAATADDAVTWAVYYYIKDVKQVLGIKQLCRAALLAEANESQIALATPALLSIEANTSIPGL